MIELSLIASLSVPAFLLAYIAFKLKEQHSVLRMFLSMMSGVFMLGIPYSGWKLAKESSLSGDWSFLIYFELAAIVAFVVMLFYVIWLYIKSTSLVISGSDDQFDEEM